MPEFKRLLPFAFLGLIPAGGVLGGKWAFLAAAATPLSVALLDRAIGTEGTRQLLESNKQTRWVPRIYIVLQLAAAGWAATRIAFGTSRIEAVGLTVSTGVTAGIFGFLAAHEMIHSHDSREQGLGMIFLASVFYMHFRIAHLFGHHRRAATIADPATARLGESIYGFVTRSVWGQFTEAWLFEGSRLRRSGYRVFGLRNSIVRYLIAEISFATTIALLSNRAIIFIVGVAVIAIALLEGFNYVAHYGLLRRYEANGRLESLKPRHSWNSHGWMNNAALFNMGHHSDHHRSPLRSFEQLQPINDEAELPFSYATAVVVALAPPLWRRLMDPRAASYEN